MSSRKANAIALEEIPVAMALDPDAAANVTRDNDEAQQLPPVEIPGNKTLLRTAFLVLLVVRCTFPDTPSRS